MQLLDGLLGADVAMNDWNTWEDFLVRFSERT